MGDLPTCRSYRASGRLDPSTPSLSSPGVVAHECRIEDGGGRRTVDEHDPALGVRMRFSAKSPPPAMSVLTVPRSPHMVSRVPPGLATGRGRATASSFCATSSFRSPVAQSSPVTSICQREQSRCPTLVSPTPYRKDDYIGSAWQHVITYFVERGYAHVVADFRGLGSSSGIAAEAMSDSEAGDGVELVEWAASQPWSDGRVGMYGVSYGGISALRTAAARPPHLRAIIPLLATADPYDDFVYPGGCFNCLGVAAWSSYMHAMQMAPPMYQDPERRWYTIWQTRLEHTEPLVVPWLEHPERDAFWRAKSIALELIEVPTFLIGGWRDIFPDAMPRAYERLGVPRKLWMGPWPHVAPDSAPIEAVEYLPVMCRWFDRFLREEHNGIDTEPPVTLFVQGGGSGWTHEDEWPIPRARVRTFFAEKDGGLVDEPVDPDGSIWYVADPTVGTQAGLWDVRGTGIGLPLDQRPDDDRSLTFTTQPLTKALEITGRPEARLSLVIVEGRDANLVVKICDVAPDGFSTLVTTGWLRAVHRSSHERVEPITADQPLEAPSPALGDVISRPGRASAPNERVLRGLSPHLAEPNERSAPPCHRRWIARSTSGRAPRWATGAGARTGPGCRATSSSLVHESTPTWRHEVDHATRSASVIFGDRRVMTTPGGDGRITLDQRVDASVEGDGA